MTTGISRRMLIQGALLASLLLVPALASAHPPPKVRSLGMEPRSILFVGNSYFAYNGGIHRLVEGLVKAADRAHANELRATSVTISGAGLSSHDVDSYLRPDGVVPVFGGEDGDVRVTTSEPPFDVVVMSDCSWCPFHPNGKATFHALVRKHAEAVRRRGARPVLFMTWAYAGRPAMTARLAEEYTLAGNETQTLVIPGGLAFAEARRQRPELTLHENDGSHPNLNGTYLAACTVYAALYGISPAGLPFDGATEPGARGLDPETARFLQEVAWETVQEYYVFD